MIAKLQTEHNLEFLRLKGCCSASCESTLVKLLEISCRGSNLLLQLSEETVVIVLHM